ncbi:MAG TPA: alpha/beta fold hydrolase [Steroidobacteraceae bacterium]|jgi:pimeloyl-ACP methyl ester carboxylesterase|nr:alpha/beta fold hydrolase [Steroidobacteraceae bacterium]
MNAPLPTLLVPGLAATARLYQAQIPALWQFGAVMVADHRRDDSIGAIARRILDQAPARFSLLGLSMGGYIAFELLRQAPGRVARLALLDTTARPDAPLQSARRRELIELARAGRFGEIADLSYAGLVHPDHLADQSLRELVRCMAQETGAEAYIRQQTAIINRPDSRADLAAIGCPTLVLVGEADQLTPPALAQEIAAGIRGAQLTLVPASGHLSTLEQPQRVNAALGEWLGAADG